VTKLDGGADLPGRIRAVVVDDEPPARSNLTVLLRRDPQIEVVAEYGGGAAALAGIRALAPDLVFLDVEMPECDGFDVLALLGTNVPAALVFVTAYDLYALRAFDAGALDYLLKPFDDARFERALGRAKERIVRAPSAPRALPPLIVKNAGKTTLVAPAEIDWIESADYYSRLHAGTRTHLLRRTMTELERELDPAEFCRVHRTAIVRLDRVRSVEISVGGEYDVVLTAGTRLPLSRRYRGPFRERLGHRAPRYDPS
jgi:two-component system LytT family response regulator